MEPDTAEESMRGLPAATWFNGALRYAGLSTGASQNEKSC